MTRKELKIKNLNKIFVLLNNLQKIGNTPDNKPFRSFMLIIRSLILQIYYPLAPPVPLALYGIFMFMRLLYRENDTACIAEGI